MLLRPLHGFFFLLWLDGTLDFIRMLGIGSAGHRADHVIGQRVSNVAAKLSFLSLIFPHQLCSDRFVHVFSAYLTQFVHHPEEDFLRTASPGQLVARIADITTGDIGSTIIGEGNAVGDFAIPTWETRQYSIAHMRIRISLTFSVDPWVVPHLLTRVNVNPPPLMLAVELGPYMVFTVPYPAHSGTGGTAQHAETVGEFTGSSSSSLEQRPNLAVSRESLKRLATKTEALVKFGFRCSASNFVLSRWGLSTSDSGAMTSRASGIVDKREEGAFEPPENRVRLECMNESGRIQT
jgi:hypothetical protein